MSTPFEKQQEIYKEFIENLQDRYEVIIADEVQLVITETGFIIESLLTIDYAKNYLTPQITFLFPLESERDFEIAGNIFKWREELFDNVKELYKYYSNLQKFQNRSGSEDNSEYYEQVILEIEDLIKTDSIDGYEQVVKTEDDIIISLVVDSYGGSRKTIVDLHYKLTNISTGVETTLNHYTIAKDDFIKDFAYQIANSNPSKYKSN